MEALAQLDLLNLEPSAKTQLAAMIAALQRASEAKDLKIQALTLELAHLRRIRFGVKSEALPGSQRDLFQDTWNEDSAAVEAEIERLADGQAVPAAKPKRARAGRQPLPDHLPRMVESTEVV